MAAAAAAAAAFDRAELHARGFTIVRGAVPLGACARARALLDDYLGPPGATSQTCDRCCLSAEEVHGPFNRK